VRKRGIAVVRNNRAPHIRFDYEEQSVYQILSAGSAAALAKKVSSVVVKDNFFLNDIPDGPKSGSSGHVLGSPFFAQKQFHQAVMITHWRQVEHELSDRAKEVRTLLEAAGPVGMTAGTVAEKLECSVREARRAIDELPHVRMKMTTADRRFSIRPDE